ncbi:hypothetical protein BC937DRAFT_88424 [Endogone sp. FLAS-F59071]|nr:hypothetical protein BC937DRAFT_88424 [Endogone sp. FLAS-F59071]|eukprot:RUS18709.1 hypothetical protein BC937DRAFT_88424 [Endogone sp. FLAS-F59071]
MNARDRASNAELQLAILKERTVELFRWLRILDIVSLQQPPIKNVPTHEPIDKVLKKICDTEPFKGILQRSCYINHFRYDHISSSLVGLYHRASLGVHGYGDSKIVIDGYFWQPNEILALGVLFTYYKVPFVYCMGVGTLTEFPYTLPKPEALGVSLSSDF